MSTQRRDFLKLLTTAAASAAFPASIARALAIPANDRTGTIEDVEHIVFMMQENQSFDHYFGTLRGVRGYGDPRAVTLATGKSVWHQPDPTNPDGFVLPFHPGAPNLGLQFLEDLAHDWTTTHAAWNDGRYDQWVPNKGATTMAHLTRSDIPYHYALADAFTVCDAYYCSLLGPTDPNRYHMWTGWVGNDGTGGGPVIDNSEAGYGWSTYPEVLEKAGISWKIYQDVGDGLDAVHFWGFTDDAYVGNYGDNSLLYFFQYQNAPDGSPLAQKGRTGTNILKNGSLFETFRKDVLANRLPQVSWMVAPEAYTRAPELARQLWRVVRLAGARCADSQPRSVEQDCLHLHVRRERRVLRSHGAAHAAAVEGRRPLHGRHDQRAVPGQRRYPAGPYRLRGARTDDRDLAVEQGGMGLLAGVRSHVAHPIRRAPFRRAPFERHGTKHHAVAARRRGRPDLGVQFRLAQRRPGDAAEHNRLRATRQRPPSRLRSRSARRSDAAETGARHSSGARTAVTSCTSTEASMALQTRLQLRFRNTGQAAAVFHVRSGDGLSGPSTSHGRRRRRGFDAFGAAAYDVSVFGPNGFLRRFAGGLGIQSVDLTVRTIYDRASGGIALVLQNHGSHALKAHIADAYSGHTTTAVIQGHDTFTLSSGLDRSFGWYDFLITTDSSRAFARHLAGHVETGRDSATDPAIGAATPHEGTRRLTLRRSAVRMRPPRRFTQARGGRLPDPLSMSRPVIEQSGTPALSWPHRRCCRGRVRRARLLSQSAQSQTRRP